MRLPLSRRLPLLASLPLLLLSTACVTRSTPPSIARTERPQLPPLSPELTRTEQLPRLTGKPSGQLVTVDKGWLAELLDLVATAIGAIERGNNRATGVALERRCTAAILSTGSLPAECPTPLITR